MTVTQCGLRGVSINIDRAAAHTTWCVSVLWSSSRHHLSRSVCKLSSAASDSVSLSQTRVGRGTPISSTYCAKLSKLLNRFTEALSSRQSLCHILSHIPHHGVNVYTLNSFSKSLYLSTIN